MSSYPRLLTSVTSINNLFVSSLSQVLEDEGIHQLCFHQCNIVYALWKGGQSNIWKTNFWKSCLSSERRRGSCLEKLKTSPFCSYTWPQQPFLNSWSKMQLIHIFFLLFFFATFQKLDRNTDTQVSWMCDVSSFHSMVCSHSVSFSKISNTIASSGLSGPVWGNINV